MFEQTMAVELERTNRTWTTMLGMAGEAVLVGAAVLAPLVSPQVMPPTQLLVRIFTPTAPAAPPPPGPPQAQTVRIARRDLNYNAGQITAPARVPDKVTIFEEPPLTAAEMGGGIKGGVEGGIPGGVLHGLPAAIASQVPAVVKPPAPVATAKPVETAPTQPIRIRRGGEVQQAQLVRQVTPVYPPLALRARIGGTVELVGIIGTDGRIRQLDVASGHPLLIRAALEAVRQWVYRPTLLNGDPVEVIAPITVHFRLN